MRIFSVSFDVQASKLSLILDRMGEVSHLNIVECAEKSGGYKVGRRRNSRSSPAKDAATDFVKKQPVGTQITTADVGAVLEKIGFRKTSASPLLSHMATIGMVKYVGRSTYQVLGKNKGSKP